MNGVPPMSAPAADGSPRHEAMEASDVTWKLVINPGADVVAALKEYARILKRNFCVLSGSGLLDNVSFNQMGAEPSSIAASLILHSMTGAVFLQSDPAAEVSAELTALTSSPGVPIAGGMVLYARAASPVTLSVYPFQRYREVAISANRQESEVFFY